MDTYHKNTTGWGNPKTPSESQKEKQRIKNRNQKRSIIWGIGCEFFWVALYIAMGFLTINDFAKCSLFYLILPIIGFFCTYGKEYNSYFFAFGIEGALIAICKIYSKIYQIFFIGFLF